MPPLFARNIVNVPNFLLVGFVGALLVVVIHLGSTWAAQQKGN